MGNDRIDVCGIVSDLGYIIYHMCLKFAGFHICNCHESAAIHKSFVHKIRHQCIYMYSTMATTVQSDCVRVTLVCKRMCSGGSYEVSQHIIVVHD